MGNSKNIETINGRLRITVLLLSVVIIALVILVMLLQREDKLSPLAGERILVKDARGYVEKYTDGFFVFDNTTTSFLLKKSLLDSFTTYPQDVNHYPTHYRIFFAKNGQNKKTLVITGAYLKEKTPNSDGEDTIINTHIRGEEGHGYDIEHVFPIDDKGNIYKVDGNGVRTWIWAAYRFPDNTSN